MRGGIAERGGVRVGHRIIEINGQSVVATAHEKIVQALSNSVGEVKLMNTNTHTYTQRIIIYTCTYVYLLSAVFAQSLYRLCI